jgi:hypothetical protein
MKQLFRHLKENKELNYQIISKVRVEKSTPRRLLRVLKEFKSLRRHIIDKTLKDYPYKKWLQYNLHFLLNYDSLGAERPDNLREEFFEALRDLYPYSGKAYHGFVSIGDINVITLYMKSIISYSKNLEIAYEFATSTDDFNSAIIVADIVDGFNFGKFLESVKFILPEDDRVYLREQEVWDFAGDCFIIDCKNKDRDEIAKYVKLYEI